MCFTPIMELLPVLFVVIFFSCYLYFFHQLYCCDVVELLLVMLFNMLSLLKIYYLKED